MSRVYAELAATFLLSVGVLGAYAAMAQANPKSWAVTGVDAGDVLNMRDVASADSRKVGSIPPDARGLKNLGCLSKQPSLEAWMRMTDAEKQDAKILWCRVEYRGRQGWVAARYLKDDSAPAN